MAVVYGCPGVTSYGRGLNQKFVHGSGCCAAFALSSDEERERRGIRWVAPEHRPASQLYEVDIIGIDQLITIVERLQREATEQPGQEPSGTIAFVQISRDYPIEQFHALVELGRPYGLVVGWRRGPQL